MRQIDDTATIDTREREFDIPAPAQSFENHDLPEEEAHQVDGSLLDDLRALVDDGRTYAQAEVAFQKSRASFTASRAKSALVYGVAAFGALHLALIAVAVGLVIALVPLVGPWFATAIVAAALVVIGLLFLRALKGVANDIKSAFLKGDE